MGGPRTAGQPGSLPASLPACLGQLQRPAGSTRRQRWRPAAAPAVVSAPEYKARHSYHFKTERFLFLKINGRQFIPAGGGSSASEGRCTQSPAAPAGPRGSSGEVSLATTSLTSASNLSARPLSLVLWNWITVQNDGAHTSHPQGAALAPGLGLHTLAAAQAPQPGRTPSLLPSRQSQGACNASKARQHALTQPVARSSLPPFAADLAPPHAGGGGGQLQPGRPSGGGTGGGAAGGGAGVGPGAGQGGWRGGGHRGGAPAAGPHAYLPTGRGALGKAINMPGHALLYFCFICGMQVTLRPVNPDAFHSGTVFAKCSGERRSTLDLHQLVMFMFRTLQRTRRCTLATDASIRGP